MIFRQRVRLFDGPPEEDGSTMLATGCVWRAAVPSPPADSSDVDRAEQLQAIIAHMPAVEVFAVQCVVEHATKYYPFSSAIYESEAYQKYRKPHFPDYILPRVMSDLPGAAGNEPQRDLVLWDARFLTG